MGPVSDRAPSTAYDPEKYSLLAARAKQLLKKRKEETNELTAPTALIVTSEEDESLRKQREEIFKKKGLLNGESGDDLLDLSLASYSALEGIDNRTTAMHRDLGSLTSLCRGQLGHLVSTTQVIKQEIRTIHTENQLKIERLATEVENKDFELTECKVREEELLSKLAKYEEEKKSRPPLVSGKRMQSSSKCTVARDRGQAKQTRVYEPLKQRNAAGCPTNAKVRCKAAVPAKQVIAGCEAYDTETRINAPRRGITKLPRETKSSFLRRLATNEAKKEVHPVDPHSSDKENKRGYSCKQQTWSGC